jgi:outer membrane lipoprotein SlyB
MNKLTYILALYIMIAVSGCTSESNSKYNAPDQQREHAEKAQGEMSSDIQKK